MLAVSDVSTIRILVRIVVSAYERYREIETLRPNGPAGRGQYVPSIVVSGSWDGIRELQTQEVDE